MGPLGDVKRPLDENSVEAVIERIRAADIEALAICLIHSYANPAHERRIAEMARSALPPGVFITCSADVLPELREYERTSTTVINAYVGPLVANYLSSLLDKLKAIDIGAPVQIMQSSGGIMRTGAVIKKPASIVESGPRRGRHRRREERGAGRVSQCHHPRHGRDHGQGLDGGRRPRGEDIRIRGWSRH